MSLNVGAFLHTTLLLLYPCYYGIHIIIFPALAEYQSYVYSSLLFPLYHSYCYSEAGEEIKFFDKEF
jgi:hypothetical protein